MADSGYYKRLFEQCEREVREYENHIAQLRKMINSFYQDFCSEQGEINGKLDCLCRALGQAVRCNTRFSAAAAGGGEGRQVSAAADAQLKEAVSALENELSELNRKKDQAASLKDSYYRSYLNAKEEERRAALEALKRAYQIPGNDTI